jgi:hypothetical protein
VEDEDPHLLDIPGNAERIKWQLVDQQVRAQDAQ